MRVCHVITKPELGGAQLSTLNILSGLSRDKYNTSIITSSRGMLSSEFKDLKGVRSFFSPFLVRPINPLYDILAFIHILSIYIRIKPRIVHTHSSKAGIIGRWAAVLYHLIQCLCKVKGEKCQAIHTVHGWSFNDYQPYILRRFFILLERITARVTTKIICVSNRDIRTGLKYKIAPKDKFVLIKYGIPLDEFRKSSVGSLEKRRELGITNNDPIVGMISCLKEQKSPLDYIKASIKIYEEKKDINFLLVGDGALKTKCMKLLSVSPLNGRFVFTGWRRDISEILDILDVVVLTSKWEGMPIAIIEALCKGRPVVATSAGGISELLKDGVTGYLVRPGAFEEVADKVLKILKNADSFNKMRREAALSVDESFSVDRMLAEIENLYQGLA